MCVHESLRVEGEWKGLHDRNQKILGLDEYDSVNNNHESVDGENEGNQNTMENDLEASRRVDHRVDHLVGRRVGHRVGRRVGHHVGRHVGAFVLPQSQWRGSWIDNEIGDGLGAYHETQSGPAQRTESSIRSAVVLGGSFDIAQMGRCVLQLGLLLPGG